MNRNPIFDEIAPVSDNYFRMRREHDPYSQILRAENTDGRSFQTVYDLFSDMEDKDAHLFSCLQTRKNGVLSKERKVIPASQNRRDREIADFVERAVFSIKNLDNSLMNILDAIGKGFSVAEIMWKITSSGKLISDELKSRFQGRFVFDEKNRLQIIDPSPEYRNFIRGAGKRHAEQEGERASEAGDFRIADYRIYPYLSSPSQNFISRSSYLAPPNKFIVCAFNSQNDNPYGRGLCLKAYWYFWFKKNNLKFWVIFNEKFGAPTVIGKYRPNASEDEKDRLLEVIESLQNDTGVTIPETVTLEFLEAHRSGSVNSYKDLSDWCNDEISKIVLGQTLTSIEGRRSGSLALGRVHERVRMEYVNSDAKNLSNLLNSTLIKMLVDFNFGGVSEYPKLVIDTTDAEDLGSEIEIDKTLVGMGIPVPVRHFYEKYKRPSPINEEKILRYDDSNLFQYHLQYGVITINEVRKTLGLPPVPWGDYPPSKPDVEQKQESASAPAKTSLPEKGEIAGTEKEEPLSEQ